MNYSRSLPIAIVVMGSILLASCEGSGGGIASIDPNVAQRLTGGSAPVESAGEQDVRSRDIFQRADSRVDTAIYFDFADASRQDVITTPSCSGTTCQHRAAGETERTDLLSATFIIGTTILTRNAITVESYFRSNHAQVGSTLRDSAFFSSIRKGNGITARASTAFGDLSRSSPPVDGVWRGMMSGVLAESDDLLLGDAVLRYSVSGSGGSLSAEFANIVNVTRSRAHTWPNTEFANVQVRSDGTFSRRGSNSRIQGGFYGNGHSEATGVFEHGEILGAFGTKR